MANLSALSPPELDAHFLRRSFDVARRAMTHGNHPFGALLVDQNGKVLIEAENGYMPSHDGTAHAERLLATQACTTIDANILRNATLYSSAEPCAMCAGAIYWAGIGRLVYGLSEHRLREFTGNHPENPTLDLPCREVFASGQRRDRGGRPAARGRGRGGACRGVGQSRPQRCRPMKRIPQSAHEKWRRGEHRGAIACHLGNGQVIRTLP